MKTAGLSRVGIYAGTFNPVHAGHVAFALQALKDADLDMLYFLPERRPRFKKGVEHFGHRVAMLRMAVQPHPHLDVLELDDIDFSIKRTLPKLESRFADAQLVFVSGSDTVEHMGTWPQLERLFSTSELLVGLRTGHDPATLKKAIVSWEILPLRLRIVDSIAPDVSSHGIREALGAQRHVKGLLASVVRYSERNWLYISLAKRVAKHSA
jgi:nicotinate-nucleotide adenylyltransferase